MREFRWIGDASIAGLALQVALVLTGFLAGTLASRWGRTDVRVNATERVLLAAAAAAVIAWFAHAGSLIGGSVSHPFFAAYVPIDVEAGYRLAVLWATLPGAALTFAAAVLVRASLGQAPDAASPPRSVTTLAVIAFVALGMALWFTPSPYATATTIPPFVQSAPAALAPLFALATLVLLAEYVTAGVTGVSHDPAPPRLAWTLSTAALVAEQMARSWLGIGPRDAIVLGSASSGLVLWLVTSALLHRRVRNLLFRRSSDGSLRRTAALAAHFGAIVLVMSFALHAVAARETMSLPPGSSVSVRDAFRRTWQLANQGVSRFDEEGVEVVSLALEATNPTGVARLLAPEIRDHHGRNGEHLDNMVSRRQSIGVVTQTLRVLLVGADSLDVASVRVTFLPLPILWPAGITLLAISLLMTRTKDSKGQVSE